MLRSYYLNTNQQPSGDYEVHVQDCIHGALPANQHQLGNFYNSRDAVAKAKRVFPTYARTINGCAYCCPDSDTD
jgi:hypothetical protein